VATGEVVAMVSPFGGPPDLQGDVIAPTAYDADIRYWNASQNKLPVLISHIWTDESANIGHVERLEAVPGYGLVATMRLDLTNERARYVHKLLTERRMVEWSIGHDTYEEKTQADGSTLLQRIHLHEISVVLKGAAATQGEPQGRTELVSVKAAHQGGTVIMDASDLDRPYDSQATAWWHVEERGMEFAVISDADGSEVGRFRTRGEPVARLVELEANNVASKGDPTYWRRAVEEAGAGREFSPERFAAEKKQAVVRAAERRNPAVAKQVDDLILATRQELVQKAKQAEWEEWMRVNTVLDPVPVRVDPRMRPIVEDNPTESNR
jgi:HK97 family phage prohead protease